MQRDLRKKYFSLYTLVALAKNQWFVVLEVGVGVGVGMWLVMVSEQMINEVVKLTI